MGLVNHEIAQIKGMLARGDRQSDIAAWFGCNSGRVAEISTGQRAAEVPGAPFDGLPPQGPYVVVPKRYVDRLRQAMRDFEERYREVG